MNAKIEAAIKKINSYPTNWFSVEQKSILTKILQKTDPRDINCVLGILLMRIPKAGFVFDYAPNANNGLISLVVEQPEYRINCDDFVTNDENKLIIGENYEALNNLLIDYKQKFDLIYIDPPYNTDSAATDGNINTTYKNKSQKFIYKDKFSRDGWLTMMKERLELASQLLRFDGIILVSIDDNEYAYLKVLMDRIFGEEKFIATMIWKSSYGGKNDATMPINTEYILLYGGVRKPKFQMIKNNDCGNYKYSDCLSGDFGKYKTRHIHGASLTYQKSLDYVIYIEKNKNLSSFLRGGITSEYVINFTRTTETIGTTCAGSEKNSDKEKLKLRAKRLAGDCDPKDWRYYYSRSTIMAAYQKNFINISRDRNGNFKIKGKTYEKAKWNGKKKKIEKGATDLKKIRNLICDTKIQTRVGAEELKSILNNKEFSYPKPTSLIKLLLKLKPKDALVLDFFAGSGTTGHAVMALNAEDNGTRRFVLVTNNEKRNNSDNQKHNSTGISIGYQICYERLQRIITGKSANDRDNHFPWLEKHKIFVGVKLRIFELKIFNLSLTKNIHGFSQSRLETVAPFAERQLNLLSSNRTSHSEKRSQGFVYELSALNLLSYRSDETN